MWKRIPEQTVPCEYCGVATRMLGTRLCDACWELETRIRYQTSKARHILECVEAHAQGRATPDGDIVRTRWNMEKSR